MFLKLGIFLFPGIFLYSRETQVSGNIMFSSATQPPRQRPLRHVTSAVSQFRCQRDNFWKIYTTFFKLALLIQISRTSSIIDIVVPSKMAAGGHFVKKKSKKKVVHRSEMARNAIESYFRTSKMANDGHFKKKTFTKKVEWVIWTMFEPTAGRIQLDINSLLVNIYTDRYVGNEGIYIVFDL